MIPLSSSPLPIRRGPQTESQNRNNVRYRERGEGSASIASVPDTPRPGGSGTAAPRRRLDYGGNAIVIDDSESERDELASPEVRPTTTSRYFTQPTQVAPDWPKATLGSRGGSSLGRKSVPSPDVGSLSLEENEEEEEHFSDDEDDDYEDEDDETNKDPVEVPASSPFRQQEKSQQGPQPPSQQPLSRFLQGNTTAARPTINAFATLMAPPGTVFRAPARVNVPQPRPSVPPAIRKTIDLSSDEDERSSGNGRYGRSVSRKESSSDEDDEDDSDAARGNIVPSTFVKGQRDIQGQKTRQPFRQQPQPEQNGQTMGLQRRNESTSAPGRPEKRNKPALVARVREVLGDSVTTSEVVKTLNSCKWDVDEAVNILLSAEDPTNSEFSDDGSETGGSSRTSSPPVDSRMANFQSLVRSFSNSSSSQQRTSKVPGTKQSEAWPSISKGAQLGSRRGERLPEGENLQRNEQRPTLVKDLPLKNKSHTMSHSSIPQKTSSQEQDRAAMREGPAKRRRLVQGRRPRNSSPSQESFPISQRAYQGNRDYRSGRSQETAITLDSSEGEAETYQTDDDDDRRRKLPKSAETLTLEKAVLKFLNKASADDIIAVSSCKRADAELMVSKQPFPSLPAARRAAHPAIANKKRKQPAGEAIVSSIQQFMTSLGKLEKYFKDCEDRGAKVQGALRSWNVDANGQRRESRSMKGDEDELHFEPEDILSDPPIARQPKMMDGHCEMKEYQLFGLNWMRLLYSIGVGCILADDMGLGKTCQVISFMCYLVEEWRRTRIGRRPWPNVIVVPPSTLSNWVAEFERFAPGLSVISYQGAQAERAEIAAELEENSEHYHVVLTTYTQVSREEDLELLQAIQPNVSHHAV